MVDVAVAGDIAFLGLRGIRARYRVAVGRVGLTGIADAVGSTVARCAAL